MSAVECILKKKLLKIKSFIAEWLITDEMTLMFQIL